MQDFIFEHNGFIIYCTQLPVFGDEAPAKEGMMKCYTMMDNFFAMATFPVDFREEEALNYIGRTLFELIKRTVSDHYINEWKNCN